MRVVQIAPDGEGGLYVVDDHGTLWHYNPVSTRMSGGYQVYWSKVALPNG
jgi:hypothetical protein